MGNPKEKCPPCLNIYIVDSITDIPIHPPTPPTPPAQGLHYLIACVWTMHISSLIYHFSSPQPHIKGCQFSSFFRSGINSRSHYLRNNRESIGGRVERQVFSVGRKEGDIKGELSQAGMRLVELG